jgi:tetratricopeptide (TPR) repeat protein
MIVATVVLVAVFGVIYYLGRHTDSGPTLADRSVTGAEAAVREKPNDAAARLGLAQAYEQAGRPEEAMSQYKEVIKAQKENRLALIGAGTILYKQGDYSGAKTYFEQVIKYSGGQQFSNADPQLESAYFYLGVVNSKLNDLPGSIKNLEAALQIDKTDADAWNTLGNVQMSAGNPVKAAAAFEQALAFVPVGWCDPYTGLKGAYEAQKMPDGAAYAAAMGEICAGTTDAGVATLETLTTGKFRIPALLGLGLASETKRDSAKALQWYKQVVAVEPTNVAALTAIARLGDTATDHSATPKATASAS